jgi:hypothetical protein
MSAVRNVILLWGGLYLAIGTLKPPGDGDLWWQRWLGNVVLNSHHLPSSLGHETFSAPGAPWVPQEWIFSVLVALAADHGEFGLFALLVSLIPAAVLGSIYLRARSAATPESIAVVLVLAGVAIGESFGVRAQVLGWGCFAAFFIALERRDRWFYASIPIAIIWANLHASVMLAPVIVAARILGLVFDNGIAALRSSRELRIFPFVAFAVLCTPFGWQLPAFAIELARSPIRHFIQEWQPVNVTDISFVFGALPLALLLLLPGPNAIWRKKADGVPLLVLFIAMVTASRNIAFFAIAAAPLAAEAFDWAFPRWRKIGERLREMERATLATIAVAIVSFGVFLAWERQHAPPIMPVAAMSSVARGSADHRVFCEDFTWCSLALQFPNLRVFMDGRCDAYPLAIWNAYIAMVYAKPSWEKDFHEYGVDTIVAHRNGQFASALSKDPSWRATFEDTRYVVYLRS